MSISYQWGIEKLQTQDMTNTNDELLQKAIVKIWYWKEGTHSDGRKGKYTGLCVPKLENTAASSFVAIGDVTEAQVIAWVKSSYETDFETKHVNKTIQMQINETTREDLDSKSFPWVS